MKMLTAQAIADEGEISVLGYELPARVQGGARARCGVVPQLDNLDVDAHGRAEPARVRATCTGSRGASGGRRSSARCEIANLGDRRDAKRGQAVGRHAPAAADRPRARAPAAARAARRADRRPGPAGAPGAVGADRRAARRGHLDPDVDALHRGGRAPGRHRDDHVPRQGGRRRAARASWSPSTRAARRSRSTGRRRGWPRSRREARARGPAHAPHRHVRGDAAASTRRERRLPEGERRPANLEDVFVLLTGEEIA